MSRHPLALALSLALACGSLLRASPADLGARPNLVFFLSDDQRFDQLHVPGNPHPILRMPTVERLARQGVRFENAFVTTSICAASRASILTGLHERTHRFTFGTRPLAAEPIAWSYPALLREAGYRTGFVGKLGVGLAPGGAARMFDYLESFDRPYWKKQKDGSKVHITNLARDKALEFLREQDADRPFCLSISFSAGHAEDSDKENQYPCAPEEDGLYDDQAMPLPELRDPAIFESQPEFLKTSMNRIRYFWRWDTAEKYQKSLRGYYRLLAGLDRVMGNVLDAIDRLGASSRTVVIFCGDNGYYMAERGFAGKWSHYDESLRVPLIVCDPGLPATERGRIETRYGLNIDIPATILGYAGLPIPPSYQGADLGPVVRNEPTALWRSDLFCEHLMKHANIPKWEGVRGHRWKYGRYFEQNPVYEFLFDLQRDPKELTNLAGDPAYQMTLEDLRSRCDELRDRYGGPYTGW